MGGREEGREKGREDGGEGGGRCGGLRVANPNDNSESTNSAILRRSQHHAPITMMKIIVSQFEPEISAQGRNCGRRRRPSPLDVMRDSGEALVRARLFLRWSPACHKMLSAFELVCVSVCVCEAVSVQRREACERWRTAIMYIYILQTCPRRRRRESKDWGPGPAVPP